VVQDPNYTIQDNGKLKFTRPKSTPASSGAGSKSKRYVYMCISIHPLPTPPHPITSHSNVSMYFGARGTCVSSTQPLKGYRDIEIQRYIDVEIDTSN
jgi:hypothetical protein